MRFRLARLAAGFFALSFLGASCGETNMQAIERLRPRGAEVRMRLARIAERLPPAGKLTRRVPAGALLPPLVMDFRHKRFNTEVLMEEQLRDPDASMDGRLDLMLSPELENCLLWTGPKNPLDKSAWDDRSGLGAECEKAFATRWLVVVRTRSYALPERVALEVFVVDFARENLVASFAIELSGRYAQSDTRRAALPGEALRQVGSDAFVVARCELGRRLAEIPGTSVDLSESWLGQERDPCKAPPGAFSAVPPRAAVVSTASETPAAPPASGPCGEARDPAHVASSLADVDWCNREYLPGVISLRAGRGELHEYMELGGVHDTDLFRLVSVSFGDLDADGKDEALVAINHDGYAGREQSHSSDAWLFVFDWHAGRARQIASETTAPVVAARIEQARVLVEIQRAGEVVCEARELRGMALVPAANAECKTGPPAHP